VSLAVFPLGIFLMFMSPVYYFIGIVISFLAAMFQTPRSLHSYETKTQKKNQEQLKWTMLMVGLYLLSGFVALIFF
jgi:hypothetical protein